MCRNLAQPATKAALGSIPRVSTQFDDDDELATPSLDELLDELMDELLDELLDALERDKARASLARAREMPITRRLTAFRGVTLR